MEETGINRNISRWLEKVKEKSEMGQRKFGNTMVKWTDEKVGDVFYEGQWWKPVPFTEMKFGEPVGVRYPSNKIMYSYEALTPENVVHFIRSRATVYMPVKEEVEVEVKTVPHARDFNWGENMMWAEYRGKGRVWIRPVDPTNERDVRRAQANLRYVRNVAERGEMRFD